MQFYISKEDWEKLNKIDLAYYPKLWTKKGANDFFGEDYLEHVVRIEINKCSK